MKSKKNVSTELEDSIVYYQKTIHGLIEDFVDEMERQQKESRKKNKSGPSLIGNIDDLIKLVQLDLSLLERLPEPRKEEKNHENEQLVKELIASDPEYRRLLRELYDRQMALKRSKQPGGA